jgi:DMSO/TMAO reductase YedYZ molybdopterin-dependent catalytic subunit
VEERTNEKRAKQIRRREILKLSPVVLLGAFAIPTVQDSLLKAGLAFHDWASAKLFRRNHLAPTFSDAEVVPFDKFPINGYDVADPGVDLDAWKLKVTGDVQRPGEYTLAQIQALPRQRQNTRHICVEGWDVIGRFGGARLSEFLDLVGANPESRFVFVECADDYYTTIDMATARHSQSLLCYEMYDRPLTREHGAPVRLSIPTKIGYKNAKYLTHMHITSVLTKNGYWEDQGYSNYYGL